MRLALENTDFMKRAISKLKQGLKDPVWKEIGQFTGEALGTFAPEDTGKMRKSFKVRKSKNAITVYWKKTDKMPYVHYQYVGVAMEPVFPVFKNSLWTDVWRTPENTHKVYAKDRHFIGEPHTVVYKDGRVAFVKGYTKPGSSNHWIDKARETPTVYNPMRRRTYEVLADAIGETIVGKRWFTNARSN